MVRMRDSYYKLGRLDFRNELIKRLNDINVYQFVGINMIDIDKVYEIIDRVFDGIPEDDGSVD